MFAIFIHETSVLLVERNAVTITVLVCGDGVFTIFFTLITDTMLVLPTVR